MEKLNRSMSIFVLILVVLMPISYSISISDVKVQEVSNRYAVVSWQTDQMSSSSVLFGTNVNSLTQSKNIPALKKNHTVVVAPLKNLTSYYFNVSSTNENGTDVKGTFNFTTVLVDNKIPFIDVVLPDYVGSNYLNINGMTEPNTEIYVYVNNNLSGSGFIVSNGDGTFSLSGIILKSGSGKTTSNSVKIVAIDPAKNKNEFTKLVVVDKSPPGITFDQPIPKGWGEKSLTVNGNSDESASMSVYLDGNLVNTVNISSPWKTIFTFTTDKKYVLRFYAVDKAGNVFDQSYETIVDTKPLSIDKENLADLNPSYVVQRTVRGHTKPGATVVILVNNRSTSEAVQYLNNVKTGAGDIKVNNEGAQNIPLGLKELIARVTGPKLNYVTTADASGNFAVDIELETVFRLNADESKALKFDTDDSWKNDVTILALDSVGRVAKVTKPIYFTRCGAGGLFTISSPIPSPTSIPEPILKQGFGQFSLTMDLKWNGPTAREDVQFHNVPRIFVQPGLSREDLRTRYNVSIGEGGKGMFKGAVIYPNVPPTPVDDTLYALVNLNPTTYDFPVSSVAKSELEFPLMIELEYSYLKPDGTRSEDVVQRKCINVQMGVEPELTDVYNPSKLLLKVTKFFDETIATIDSVLKPVRTAQTYAIYGCGIGIVTQFLKTTGTKFICKGKDIRDYEDKCTITSTGSSLSCNCGGDASLQSCCDSTISSLEFQKYAVNTVCDRLFCPSVPSLPKHVKSYSDLIVKPSGITGTQLPSSYGEVSQNVGAAGTKCARGLSFGYSASPSNTECENEFQRAWGTTVLFDWPSNNEYDLAQRKYSNSADIRSGIAEELFRVSEFTSNICNAQPTKTSRIIRTGRKTVNNYPEGWKVSRTPTPPPGGTTPAPSDKVETQYTVDYGDIIEYSNDQVEVDSTGKITKIKARSSILGKDVANPDPNNIDGNSYFSPIYSNLQFNKNNGQCDNEDCKRAAFGGQPAPSNIKVPPPVLAAVNTGFSAEYVYGPTSGIIPAVKSACIPAVNGYLTSYRNILAHVNACFKTIAETGKGNSAGCQALLSEVVCDFAIDAISCVGSATNNWAKQNSGWGTGPNFIVNPFAAVSQASSSITDTISNRYGETAGFQALFNENALVHSLCIGAFTGDWDLEGISNLFTQATLVPVKSTCVAFPGNRRFVTSNPLKQGKPTYLYYVGGMIAAGSDISSFSLQLVCSNDNSCTKYGTSSNPNGKCDCTDQPNEKVLQVNSDKYNLKQGDVWDDAKYISIPDQEYRYDKLRIMYTYKDSNGKDVTEKCTEVQLKEDGFIPPSCSFTVGLGFRCEFKIGDQGFAKFAEKPKPTHPDGLYYVDDRLEINTKTEVVSPDPKTPKRKYVRYTVRNNFGKVIGSPLDVELEEGVSERSDKPGFIIKKDYFVSQPEESITIEGNQYQNGALIVGNSKVADAGAADTKFVVTFTDSSKGSYYCNDVEADGKIQNARTPQAIKFTSADPTTGALIRCGGVQFRLTNFDRVSPTPPNNGVPESGKSWKEYGATAYLVNYRRPVQAASCSSDPVDWSVEATLYHSETSNPFDSTGSSTHINIKAPIITETVPIKVICDKGTATGEAQLDFTVQDLILNPKQVSPGSNIVVRYTITSNKGMAINDLKLNLVSDSTTRTIDLDKTKPDQQITIPDDLPKKTYDVVLMINGKEYYRLNKELIIS